MSARIPASLWLALGAAAAAVPFNAALAANPTAAAPAPAPQPAADIEALKKEMATLRAQYEASLQAMDARLRAAESAAATAATSAPPTAPVAAAPAVTAVAAPANALNPNISLILSGGYTHTRREPSASIKGFQLPADAEVGPGERGFNLGETELGLSANIDPWLRGAANIALGGDGSVSVEEAFLQTTALSNGLSLKAGRFFSGVGYLNEQHGHTWDFVDNPLAYQAMLGTQYGDDGLQLRWLAPTDQFFELGAELGRGRGFPGSDTGRNGAGMASLFAHVGGDVGDSHSWRAGASWLRALATDQELSIDDAAGSSVRNAFSGKTQVTVLDGVWKWAPGGNATRTSFKLQGEYLRSRRDGTLVYDLDNANSSDVWKGSQSGWYLQGIYQFMPRWRVGLRTERLSAGGQNYGANQAALANLGEAPRKQTLMLDYSASEFSRVRLQLAVDQSRTGASDRQIQLQYQMSLGAHGAHSF